MFPDDLREVVRFPQSHQLLEPILLASPRSLLFVGSHSIAIRVASLYRIKIFRAH